MMTYQTKDFKRISLTKANHPKLKGMCRMVLLSVGGKWTQALGGKGINNPWLPEKEAIENIKEHAERLGWKEEEGWHTQISTEYSAPARHELLQSLAQTATYKPRQS